MDFASSKAIWTQKVSNGELVLGAYLPTKDGRRVGNAQIIGIFPGVAPTFVFIYTVICDNGNKMMLTRAQVEDLFHAPSHVADIKEVRKRFKEAERIPELAIDDMSRAVGQSF